MKMMMMMPMTLANIPYVELGIVIDVKGIDELGDGIEALKPL